MRRAVVIIAFFDPLRQGWCRPGDRLKFNSFVIIYVADVITYPCFSP
jgi:hypothetical protein